MVKVLTTSESDLPNQVLGLDRSILYCAIIDKLGHILASKERKPAQFNVSRNDAERSAMQQAIRHFSTPSWAVQFGEIYYNITRHEKIIGGIVRVSKDHLMIVAFDVNTSNFDEIIMKKIVPLIKETRSGRLLGSQT